MKNDGKRCPLLMRKADLSWTSRHVRDVPNPEVADKRKPKTQFTDDNLVSAEGSIDDEALDILLLGEALSLIRRNR